MLESNITPSKDLVKENLPSDDEIVENNSPISDKLGNYSSSDRTISIAVASSRHSKSLYNETYTFAEFAKKLCAHTHSSNKDVWCFIQGELTYDIKSQRVKTDKVTAKGKTALVKRNGRRVQSNIARLHIMAFDIDAGGDFDAAVKSVKSVGLCGVVYTSYSHKPEHHKFRVVLFLTVPFILQDKASIKRWKQLYEAVGTKLNLPYDKSCSDITRTFYFPNAPKDDTNARTEVVEGDLLDLATFAAPATQKGFSGSLILANRTVPDVTVGDFSLTAWELKFAKDFRCADLIADKSPDRITGDRSEGGYTIHCPYGDEHKSGITEGAFVTNGTGEAGFTLACSHDTCKSANRGRLDNLKKLIELGEITTADLEDPKYGGGSVIKITTVDNKVVVQHANVYQPNAARIEGEFQSLAAKAAYALPVDSTQFKKMVGVEEYMPVPLTNANVYLFLNAIGVVVLYNEFSGKYMAHGLPETGPSNVINDPSLRALYKVACDLGFDTGFEPFIQTIYFAADQNHIHPVREYLNGIEWDGIERLDRWLIDYAGAADTPYNRAVGRITLIGAVRRVMQPGCKFDTMPILEGSQGTGKSSLLCILAGNQWFTDSYRLGMSEKEMIEITAGKWIIEIAELAGISKKEVQHVRADLSRMVDSARLAYGHTTSEVPRQSIFVGTINESEYLNDNEGSRRTLPVKTGKIDLEGLQVVRDQLWAEAARGEAKGEPAKIPEELYETAAGEAEKRRVKSVTEDTLIEALEGYTDNYVTPETLYLMLGHGNIHYQIAAGKITVSQKNEIAYTMKRLGWANTEDGKDARRSVPVTKNTKVQKRVWIIGKGTKQVEHTADNPNQIDVSDILPRLLPRQT